MRFLVLLIILIPIFGFKCQTPQRVGWISFQTLSGMDHIAYVFEWLNNNLTTRNQSYNKDGVTYSLNNFKISAWYNDAKQKQSFLNENTSNVKCGDLTISYQFDYSISGSKNGTAYGKVKANQFSFNKSIVINKGVLTWKLQTKLAIDVPDNMTIESSSPNLSQAEKSIFQSIINNKILDHENSLMKNSMTQLSTFTNAQLLEYLLSEHIVVVDSQKYTFKNFTITYENKIVGAKLVDTEKFKGMQYECLFEVENYTEQCINMPKEYLSEYLGYQQMIAFPWLQANLFYIAKNGFFNKTITSKDWDTSQFQFYLGDFANVIEQAQNQNPSIPVTGKCEWQSAKIESTTFDYLSFDTAFAKIPMICVFSTQNQTIQTITFSMGLSLNMKLAKKYLSVVIRAAQVVTPVFKTEGKYVVTDQKLASFYLKNVLSKLLNQPTFGDHYETSLRKLPSFRLRSTYIVMYDGSEV